MSFNMISPSAKSQVSQRENYDFRLPVIASQNICEYKAYFPYFLTFLQRRFSADSWSVMRQLHHTSGHHWLLHIVASKSARAPADSEWLHSHSDSAFWSCPGAFPLVFIGRTVNPGCSIGAPLLCRRLDFEWL